MRKSALIIISVIVLASGLFAETTNTLAIEAGLIRSVRQSSLEINAGVSGLFHLERIFLLGGYGGYIGNDEMHIGNGGVIAGIRQVFADSIVLSVEGLGGLGGGVINNEGGAVYIYCVSVYLGYYYSKDACAGAIIGYRSVQKLLAFEDRAGYGYYFVGLRLALGPSTL